MENKSLTEASELNYDWQINLVEGEKNIYKSNNKYENVEINFVFKNQKSNNYENKEQNNKLLRMNYYEFSEILENLKKLDQQLHMFKN